MASEVLICDYCGKTLGIITYQRWIDFDGIVCVECHKQGKGGEQPQGGLTHG